VPGDSLFFVDGYNLGATGILDTLFLSVLTGLTSGTGVQVATPEPGKTPEEIANEQFDQLEQVLGFNLKTDFIDQLTGEFGLAVWGLSVDDDGSLNSDNLGFLLVSDAATPATVSDAVSKLSLLVQAGLSGQGTVTTKVVGNGQINVLTVNSGSGSTPIIIEYGVVNGQFVLGYGSAVDDYLAGTTTPLSKNADYQKALGELPAQHNGILYLKVGTVVQVGQAASSSLNTSSETKDASEKCAAYPSQGAAQKAFDADQATNWELDQDFDGQACEDYFAPATAEASPEASAVNYDALKALVSVSFVQGNLAGSSSILLIEG
jgi:Protein of unknown function (DUF3352)